MILPDPARQELRRQLYHRRLGLMAAVFVVMVLSVLLPTIGVQAGDGIAGRSLLQASRFFLKAQPSAEAFAGASSGPDVAIALNVIYLGLAAHQLGILTGLGSFWVLAAEEPGPWSRRLMLFAGWLLILGAPTMLIGALQLDRVGIPTYLGVAWLPMLTGGATLLVGGRLARKRVDASWFWTLPEVTQN